MTRKMNKKTLEFVKEINLMLRVNKVKNEHDNLVIFTISYLLKHNMYYGYNFFKWVPVNENMACSRNAKYADRYITESGNTTDYDFIQFYVDNLSIGPRLESEILK